MLGQTAFRLAKSPVFVTHQTENRKQLGLRELMLAETATVGRQNPARDLRRHPSKRQQPNFSHRQLLLHQKTPEAPSCRSLNPHCAKDVNRATLSPFIFSTYQKEGEGVVVTVNQHPLPVNFPEFLAALWLHLRKVRIRFHFQNLQRMPPRVPGN
jgi:hypothetical protein